MTTHILPTDVTYVSKYECLTEASDLQWPPGYVSKEITTEIGNGQPFVLDHVGDVSFTYKQHASNFILVVLND